MWCSWSGYHPQDDLAIFGYRLDINVLKKSESFYILGYLLKLIIKTLMIWNLFFCKIWWIWAMFLMENPLYSSKSFFFRSKFGKTSPPKRNIDLEPAFFYPIFWCSQSGNHPGNKKRKGDCIPDVKASYKKDPSISLATYWNF